MNRRSGRRAVVLALSFAAMLVLGSVGSASASRVGTGAHASSIAATVKAKEYANCTALNKVYPHGVGRKHAKDHVSGSTRKVTNFRHSNKLYSLNKKSDRDGDKIACEKL